MEIDGDTIILEIEYDDEEILRPLQYRIKDRPLFSRMAAEPRVIVFNFLGGLAVLYFLDLMSLRSIIIAAGAAIFVSAFASVALLDRATALIALIQQKYRDRGDRRCVYRFVLSTEGIKREGVRKAEASAWPDIRSAIETEQDILVLQNDGPVYSFPKRIFQDFHDLAYFKNFIRDRIGDRAEL
jgi:hypothetical protein